MSSESLARAGGDLLLRHPVWKSLLNSNRNACRQVSTDLWRDKRYRQMSQGIGLRGNALMYSVGTKILLFKNQYIFFYFRYFFSFPFLLTLEKVILAQTEKLSKNTPQLCADKEIKVG